MLPDRRVVTRQLNKQSTRCDAQIIQERQFAIVQLKEMSFMRQVEVTVNDET